MSNIELVYKCKKDIEQMRYELNLKLVDNIKLAYALYSKELKSFEYWNAEQSLKNKISILRQRNTNECMEFTQFLKKLYKNT